MEPQLLAKDVQVDSREAAFRRLRCRADFRRVARGRRKSVEGFVLQAARRAELGDEGVAARIGFTVTRKIGRAVERNRIRRRLKETLKAACPLEAESDHDYVLIARREALSCSFAALVGDLREAFRAVRCRARDDCLVGRLPPRDTQT